MSLFIYVSHKPLKKRKDFQRLHTLSPSIEVYGLKMFRQKTVFDFLINEENF